MPELSSSRVSAFFFVLVGIYIQVDCVWTYRENGKTTGVVQTVIWPVYGTIQFLSSLTLTLCFGRPYMPILFSIVHIFVYSRLSINHNMYLDWWDKTAALISLFLALCELGYLAYEKQKLQNGA